MSNTKAYNINQNEKKTTYRKDYQVPVYLVDEVSLYFDLHDDETIVKSSLQVRRNNLSHDPNNVLELNGNELILASVTLDGALLSKSQYQLSKDKLTIPDVPDNFVLEIVTKIFPQKNTALSGLYCSNGIYCTQCEPQGFRRITYYLDHPDVLARYTTTIEADKEKYPLLLSNGNIIDLGELDNGRHWVKWQDPFRKPSYLFALVAGDFDVLIDRYTTVSGRDVDLRIYVEKGHGEEIHYAMHSLKEAMRWDEKTYGREYDLNIYMIVAISDFNAGAMENKGLNIFNTKCILAKPETAADDDFIYITAIIGHEYFHNWSGNRVTCRDWFQLSLKEGLTIFREQSFMEDTFSKAVMRIRDVTVLREVQFPEDAGPLAHSVRPESYIEINNFYTTTVYHKGAEVLRMLRTMLGNELFRKGMDLYFARFDGQAVTIDDYVKTMEEVSNSDLTQFRLWYSQAGTPVIKVIEDYDSINKVYTLTFTEIIEPTPGQPTKEPMLIPIRMGLIDHEGKPMELFIEDKSYGNETVILLKDHSQIFRFQKVTSTPIPSLLRGFSAPVILNFSYKDSDLLFLYKHDPDHFNRFEAGQKYMLRVLLNLARDYSQGNPLTLGPELPESFRYLMQHENEDKYLLAEMLTIPSEKYVGEQMEVIDVTAIHAAREFVVLELAKQLENEFLANYQQYHDGANNKFDMSHVGTRKFKNMCLAYLMKLNKYAELGFNQFNAALKVNMADTQAALVALASIDTPLKADALQKFYDSYKDDALVVDKWFAIQAASKLPNTLGQVKKLTRHPAFDIKNPNKVYALIRTFTSRNAVNFHTESGEGYAFLRDIVQQLDKINPQIAARMVDPLTRWQRYDKERKRLMREQLEVLLQDKKISSDLYELVTKSLVTKIDENR